jgi:hypothetical protein
MVDDDAMGRSGRKFMKYCPFGRRDLSIGPIEKFVAMENNEF